MRGSDEPIAAPIVVTVMGVQLWRLNEQVRDRSEEALEATAEAVRIARVYCKIRE